jgi:hypothetical protein
MQRDGVKRAEAIVDFTWQHDHSADVRIVKTLYFESEATNCSQITDREKLGRIKADGLEEQLAHVTSDTMSQWQRGSCFEMPADTHLAARVEVEDDKRPPLVRELTPLDVLPGGRVFLPYADEIDAQFLAASQGPASEKNQALVKAPTWGDDSCIVDALLTGGANVDARDKQKATALMNAAEFGHLADLKRLLSAGAAVNLQDVNGDSALIRAARFHQTEAVKALLDAHADLFVTSSLGTSLDEAAKHDFVDVIDLIRQAETQRAK